MITLNDKDYELHFSTGRMELVEAALESRPFLMILQGQSGNYTLSMKELHTIFGLCLREPGADTYLPRKQAIEVCDRFLETAGYAAVTRYVQEQAQHDLPFLFRTA